MSVNLVTYTSLTESMNSVFNSGATPNVCLFLDAEGTIHYHDAAGNVYDRISVLSVNYTQPHNDAEGAPLVNGFVSIAFANGNTVIVTDNVDTVYYSIVAVPFAPRRFN
jgi:hypothetical protein